MAKQKKTEQTTLGRPSSGISKQNATYSLPVRLVELVADQAYHERLSKSDLVARALIEYLSGHSVKPRPEEQSLVDLAKGEGIDL
jgi:hypothetical protein